MKAYSRNPIRTIVLANFVLCILVQFIWLGYASAHGMPVSQKFLMWQQQRWTPAFAAVFMGPFVLAGYFAGRRGVRQSARIMAAVMGISGVYGLVALLWPDVLLYLGRPQVFDANMV